MELPLRAFGARHRLPEPPRRSKIMRRGGFFCYGVGVWGCFVVALRALAARGVLQVVDLRLRYETDGNETALCQKLGLVYVSVPMGEGLPDFPAVERLLGLLASSPTYVHCQHGCDRSGAIVALYRTVVQGWSVPQAGVELLRNGFDAELEVLARDICFYARELRRTRHTPSRSVIALSLC